jgi:hypothetical protein
VAEKLNYRPNVAARNLKLNRNVRIAVHLPKKIASFYDQVRDGISAAARDSLGVGVAVDFRTYECFGQEDTDLLQRDIEKGMTDLFWHLAALERWTRCCERVPTRVAYEYILANYVLPKWGPSSIQSIKAVSIEDLLRSLAKANGTKAKIREVFGATFRHAMRYELYPPNPITNVRQVRKRTIEPSILEPAEIAAILQELEGTEPVRTALLIAAVMGMRRSEIFGLKWASASMTSAIRRSRSLPSPRRATRQSCRLPDTSRRRCSSITPTSGWKRSGTRSMR